MRVYRILGGPRPQLGDFASLAARGRPVPQNAPPVVQRKWSAVSAFTTMSLARKRASEKDLGSWWAEMELPDTVEVELDAPNLLGRHVSIYGQTADQLLGYVVAHGAFATEGDVE